VIFLLGARTFRVNGAGAYSREFIPELVQFCLPYLVYGICIWLLSGVDRYILQANVSFEGLNSYDLVLKCFIGIDFLQNSLSAVIFPRIYEIWAKNGEMETTTESNRYFNVFTVINIFQLIVFCLLLPLLYQLVIRKEYFFDGQRFLSIIAAGYALRSVVSFFLAGVLFSKSTRLMLLIFGISALVQICASAIAIPAYGLDGALYAMLFTRVVQAILFAVLAPGVFRFTFNKFKIFVIPALFVLLNAGYYAWAHDHSPLFFVAQLVLFTVIAGIAFRKELVAVASSLAGEKQL
jgi:O-antigen/teichoic acid export membrane protein